MKKLILVALLGFVLTGCAGLDEDFSCKETTGGKCITVGEANDIAIKSINNKNIKPQYLPNKQTFLGDSDNSTYPSRTKEVVRKIYIATYIDKDDNYHKEQTIYFPINSPLWNDK